MATPKLFTPVQVGNLTLQHRIVLAPLTRIRAKKNHVHNKIAVEYYSQRASTPGTLLITEDTIIAPQAGGANNVPGIWNDEQIAIWKEVANAVHSKGSFIYLQLWALGRLADPSVLDEGPYPYVSASDVKLSDKHAALYISAQGERVTPRPLTTEEIKQYVHWYAIAASNAVHKAGFDGVEIHAAGGNLIDQFLQDVTNKRTDQYGGTIENRARFALEVVDAVVRTIGARRMGIKIGPWAEYNEMRMQDPVPTFTYLVQQLASRYSDMAYLHVTEPRVNGEYDTEVKQGESNDFIRRIWAPRPYVSTGGYDRALALDMTEKNDNELIALGRRFISNPDLVLRLKKNLPLAAYDRSTFYTAEAVKGYLDYPIADENKAEIGLV